MSASAFAPAKVNLYLHVGEREEDGYHPISTLAVFANVGDVVSIEEGQPAGLEITGPFAGAFGDDGDNLVLRALRAFERAAGLALPPLRLQLDKQLPVAAGLGGGSSDAAATLRLLRARYRPDMPEEELAAVALELGADGPMCLAARPVLAEGRGERLTPFDGMPDLWAVLVNPGVESPTAAVYRRFDEGIRPRRADLARIDLRSAATDPFGALSRAANDLELPAVSLEPRIAEPLDWLRDQPETRIARLSGSGATSFALCQDRAGAQALHDRVKRDQSPWWARVCRLGGPWVGQAGNH